MSMKLRELIRAVRACKTAADERAVVAKECALIRTSFKSKENPYRHRNVAKLLYIHMLGYPTHFGQMESMKLVASPTFPEKRIGYLGLMILLDEKQKVLMLVTNSLKNDMQHKNPYIVGLALSALGNICSQDMARDLAAEVEKFFRSPNAYIRKKACLCAVRIIRKAPELIEEFVPSVQPLLQDKNHAVLLTAATLMIEMIRIDSKLIPSFRKHVPQIVRLLKNLVLAGYVSEYDVVGITDPFLQGKLIHLLRLLGTSDKESSEYMNDILAQVAINTEPTKNPGNAILYETVLTIMNIEAEGGLRVLAINILGRFLANRDNNIRYVALNTLCRCVNRDTQAIQRHRNTIVDCLKDADISIRRRALDLIYALVTKNNVKALVKELLNYLALTSGDNDFKADLTEKICLVVEKFAPNKHWHIDTIITVLATAGNFARENVFTDLISLISRSSENLQAYSTYKLYEALFKKTKHAQLPLMHLALWCIGEYGEVLVSDNGVSKAKSVDGEAQFAVVGETKVLDLISKVIKSPVAVLLTREYLLNCLIKLTARFTKELDRVQKFIATYHQNMQVELQQRACEYSALSSDKLSKIRSGIVARMPIPEKKTPAEGKVVEVDEDEEDEPEEGGDEAEESEETEEEKQKATAIPKSNGVAKKANEPAAAPVELDIFGNILDTSANNNGANKPTNAAPANTSAPKVDLLDLFGGSLGSTTAAPPVNAAPAKPTVSLGGNSLDALFGGVPSSQPVANAPNMFGGPAFGGPTLGGPSMFPPTSPPAPMISSSSSAADPLAALFGGGGSSSSVSNPTVSVSPRAAPSSSSAVTVFESKGLVIQFAFDRSPVTPEVTVVRAIFVNNTDNDFSGFDFQVAVQKHVTLNMEPISSTTIPKRSQSVTQKMTLNNSQHGIKKLVIRVKIDYQVNGSPVSETGQIDKFPA